MMNLSCDKADVNSTAVPEHEAKQVTVSSVIYGYVLPIVCIFGIVGNLLNLAILTRRKLRRSFKTLEQAANICLIALALSDLMFCTFAFPTTFLPNDDKFETKGFMLYYRVYCYAIINVFILSSTWLTVTMSVERYLAICHPFKETFFLTITKTKVIIIIVYTLSVLFNIPVIWRFEIDHVTCNNGSVSYYKPERVDLAHSTTFDDTYRVLWAIVGNICPLILLVVLNICLVRKIHKSYKFRQKFHTDNSNQSDAGQTLTITLVVIVVMFLILVAPSEIVLHVAQFNQNDGNETSRTIEVVLNFMQSVNFSVNFVLYCIISPYYRKTLKYILCCTWYFRRKKNFYLEMSMKEVTYSHYTKKAAL